LWRLSKTKLELQVRLERASLPNASAEETDEASLKTVGDAFVERLLLESDGGMNEDLVGAFNSGGAQQVRVPVVGSARGVGLIGR
jgi:hypothetical protein